MLENVIQQFAELHHVVFFVAGVIVAGVMSGLCAFYKARSAAKHIVVKMKA